MYDIWYRLHPSGILLIGSAVVRMECLYKFLSFGVAYDQLVLAKPYHIPFYHGDVPSIDEITAVAQHKLFGRKLRRRLFHRAVGSIVPLLGMVCDIVKIDLHIYHRS